MVSLGYITALEQLYDLWSYFGVDGPNLRYATSEWRLSRFPLIRSYLDTLCPGWKDIKYVHVTGTCGKGTTAAGIAAHLHNSGIRTGLLTSPHVFDPAERIWSCGRHIDHDEWQSIWSEIMAEVDRRWDKKGAEAIPTFQESLLYLALIHFTHSRCQYAVLEVGRGGLYDPTNVVTPVASVITNIHLDHTEVMGPTHMDIAREKAGIIKPHAPLFTSESKPEILRFFEERCRGVGASMHTARFDDLPLAVFRAITGNGDRDLVNTLKAERRDIMETAGIKLRGRFERMGGGIIADIAHNPVGMRYLMDLLAKEGIHKTVFVFGASDGKDIRGMLEPVLEDMLGSRKGSGERGALVITKGGFRYTEPRVIYELALDMGFPEEGVRICEDAKKALNVALNIAGDGGEVVVTGSVFVVDQALNPCPELRALNSKPSRRVVGRVWGVEVR